MKKKFFRMLNLLLMVVLCMTMLAPAVSAAADSVDVTVPVEVVISGTHPYRPEKFKIKLLPDEDGFPMPEGSEDGVSTVTIEGEGKDTFPPITFDERGIFTYTIYQVEGKDKHCNYDDTVYQLVVTVINGKNGGLEAVAVLHPDGNETKTDDALFHNQYRYEPTDVPQTSDESNFPLYALLAGGSVLVLLVLFLTRKKNESV